MIGNQIINFDLIDSTNDYIKKHLESLSHGTIVTASKQSKGRGRLNNTWQSPLGNLYFSFVLKQNTKQEDLFSLQITVSLALIKLLEIYNVTSKIKYPNDILVNNKKIAGILIETSGYTNIESIIIGIGLNLNQIDFYDLNVKATSVKKENGISYEALDFLNQFIVIYNSLKYNQSLYFEYILKSNTIGKTVTYNDKKYIVKNILENGNLLLSNNDEDIEIHFAKISFTELYNSIK
jgi:BirA family biotin operon repressor/biotin-[acetyl-CoA-carboxylase] ligase